MRRRPEKVVLALLAFEDGVWAVRQQMGMKTGLVVDLDTAIIAELIVSFTHVTTKKRWVGIGKNRLG